MMKIGMNKFFCTLVLFLPMLSYGIPINNLIETKDFANDYTGKIDFNISGINSSYDDQFFYVCVQVNLPKSGILGNDSYAYNNLLSPGDLFILVNNNKYGLATTTHGNVVQQAYKNETWTNVVEGNMYSGADFATGTFEKYQQLIGTEFPGDDGDGNNKLNSYSTLIKNGVLMNNTGSSVLYNAVSGKDWQYEICYQFLYNSLNIKENDKLTFSWSMECGNDAIRQDRVFAKTVPEPMTIGMIMTGLIAFSVKNKKRII